MSLKKWAAIGLLTLAALMQSHEVIAFIQKLFPLQEFIDDSDFLFTAKVERVDPDKPSAVLLLSEHLKGKAPFTRLPINLTGDKQKHTPQLLKRIAPDLPLVVGVKKQDDGKFMLLAFTNGTWFFGFKFLAKPTRTKPGGLSRTARFICDAPSKEPLPSCSRF